jgi:hypothetical protein
MMTHIIQRYRRHDFHPLSTEHADIFICVCVCVYRSFNQVSPLYPRTRHDAARRQVYGTLSGIISGVYTHCVESAYGGPRVYINTLLPI